jgi:hypothetical protein
MTVTVVVAWSKVKVMEVAVVVVVVVVVATAASAASARFVRLAVVVGGGVPHRCVRSVPSMLAEVLVMESALMLM